jgi:hypothetical protein
MPMLLPLRRDHFDDPFDIVFLANWVGPNNFESTGTRMMANDGESLMANH